MTAPDPIRELLERHGCPSHVIEAGLEGLIEQWEHTVDDVEEIYPLGLDDYLNDLDGRQLLEEALEVAPESARRSYHARVMAADERMKQLVQPAGRCLWGVDMAEQYDWTPAKNWWYFSQPRELGPELKEDLETR
jgi:hypothetical protein